MRFTVLMPWPISVNHAFGNAIKGRVKTPPYYRWLERAEAMLSEQMSNGLRLPARPYEGPLFLEIQCNPPDKRKRDISNIIKLPEDLLVKWAVIADDHHVERIHIKKDRENVSPGNILVTVEEM